MKTEFYNCIKNIDISKLIEDDKEELLNLFMVTKNPLIRNHLAFIFSDLHYHEAVPFMLKKIQEKELYNTNGSIIYALENLDIRKHFMDFIKIICDQSYEARLTAFTIIKDNLSLLSENTIQNARKYLEERREKLIGENADTGEDSTLNFIDNTLVLLNINLTN